MMSLNRKLGVGLCVALIAALGACGGTSKSATPNPTASGTSSSGNTPAPEFNPAGDIPDNQAFVDFAVTPSRVHLKVPEGWARSSASGTTTFTDHYNSVAIAIIKAAKAPTVASATSNDVPALKASVTNFSPGKVTNVTRQHGTAIHITYYLDSPPDSVTGKVVTNVAERFEFWNNGEEAVLTLTGAKGADNVDAWKLVSDSLQWK